MEFTSYTPGMPIEGTQLLDDGTHEVVIVDAEDGYDQDGTARTRVTFAPASGPSRFAWPVLKVGDNKRGLRFAVALADAIGVGRSDGLILDPADLKGQRVRIVTRQYDGNDGRRGVGVDSIQPTEAPTKQAAGNAKPKPTAPRPAKPQPVAAVAEAPAREPSDDDADFPF
jgi:hypothetical protein